MLIWDKRESQINEYSDNALNWRIVSSRKQLQIPTMVI